MGKDNKKNRSTKKEKDMTDRVAVRRELAKCYQTLNIVCFRILNDERVIGPLQDVVMACKNEVGRAIMHLERLSYDQSVTPEQLDQQLQYLLVTGRLAGEE